jgi:hypothetical protein
MSDALCDVVYVLATLLFFAASALLVASLDRLQKGGRP